jgi:hypothetical protein
MNGVCNAEDQSRTANEHAMKLVRAHESSSGLIHQFDIEVEISILQPASASMPAVQTGTTRWARKDSLERIRAVDFIRRDGFGEVERTLFADQFDDGKERRILRGWDPDHPVSLSPGEQHGLSGYLERQAFQKMSMRDPAPLLLLSLRDVTDTHGPRLSLRQVVRQARAIEVRDPGAQDPPAPDHLISLRIWRDAAKNKSGANSSRYFDVFFDPRAGMMVRKLVNHHDQYAWPGAGTLPWAEWVHEVTSYHDAGNGVFFPIQAEMRVYRSDRKEPTSIVQIKPKAFTVNKALPADALDFRFPENTTVISEEAGKRTVYLWGPKNQPVREMHTREEWLQAQLDFDKAQKLASSRSRYLVWMMVGAAILLGVTVAGIRLRRRRAKS